VWSFLEADGSAQEKMPVSTRLEDTQIATSAVERLCAGSGSVRGLASAGAVATTCPIASLTVWRVRTQVPVDGVQRLESSVAAGAAMHPVGPSIRVPLLSASTIVSGAAVLRALGATPPPLDALGAHRSGDKDDAARVEARACQRAGLEAVVAQAGPLFPWLMPCWRRAAAGPAEQTARSPQAHVPWISC